MTEYKGYYVKIFPAAQNDFMDIMDAAGTLSPEMAEQYRKAIMEKMEKLTAAPDSYPLARDTLLRIRGYRTLQFENYVVFYIINNKCVEIHRILRARRQYARLL